MTTNDLVDISRRLVVPKYILNHSKPVTAKGNFTSVEDTSAVCLLDTGIVKRKFELWDSVVRDNLLNHADPIIRARAVSLLKDKTILAYSQFRFDGKPVRMYYMQDAILSDDHERILFCGCNQFVGKSMTMNLDAATEFLIDHGKNWVGILVSGSLPQSQYQMSRIKMLLRGGDIVYREENTVDTKTGKTDNSTQLSYTFYSDDGKTPLYRNLLICCPHTSSALGYPADVMLLDEFDFWDNCDQHRFMYQVIIPRTFQTKGKIKIYTNPDGTEKMMHQLWNQKDKDGNPVWHRYHFNCWDKDGFTQVDFDRASQGMTRERIESTLLGLFTSSRGAYFTNDEIARSLDPDLTTDRMVGKQPFFFLDVGSKHDQSVLVGGFVEPDEERKDTEGRPLLHVYVPIIHAYPVGYPLSRVVGLPNIPDTDGWHYEKSVKDYMDEWTVNGVFPVLGLDVTGNSGISPLLNTVNLYPIDVTFSGPVKSGMYQRFKYLMEKGRVHRIRSAEFEYQAQHLKMKKSMRGYLMIHHETEDDLDDVCFAAGTMIRTLSGNVPIELICSGDEVLTSKGSFHVTDVHSRNTEIISKFGFTATPDHPFITNNGIKGFKYLTVSDLLYKWNNQKSGIMESSIIDILNQNIDIFEIIFGVVNKLGEKHNLYIDRNGLIRLAKSRTDIVSIIKMAIHLTMKYLIWNALNRGNICQFMEEILYGLNKNEKISLKTQFQNQKNGTGQKRGWLGIGSTQEKVSVNEKVIQKDALFVIKNILRFTLIQDSAHQGVMRKYGLNLRDQLDAPTAEESIIQLISGRLDSVAGSVLQPTTGTVYNLTVHDQHEYFANDILVHNCDSCAGLISLTDNPDNVECSMAVI